MEEILKSLHVGQTVEQVAQLLYGDGAYEVVKSMTAEKQERRDKALQNVAIGTNMVGSVAGPAAIGLAYRSAKKNEGGTPRAYAPNVASRLKRAKSPRLKKVGEKISSGVNALNNPATGSKKVKVAAAATGATLVGLQGINWGGDMLSTKLLNDQKKKDNTVSKSTETVKLKLVKAGAEQAFDDENQKKVKLVARKVKTKVSKDMDVHWAGEISKRDEDKRQVFGWASVIELDGKPVVDYQDDIIDLDTIEKAAYDYVQLSRKGGNQHQRDGEEPLHVSDLVESFVLTPEKKVQMGLPDTTPTGWWVGFKVNDDDTWADVKNGKLKEFSIHGKGVRKAVEV